MKKVNVYLVGDSTVSSFNDITYYYPRYGYGTMLDNYLDSQVKVVNLAMSGRSSKSFLKEKNYETLINNLGEDDYLLIGFGHNDEKYDDPARFSSALFDEKTEGSFKYNLYNFYIKKALDVKANPILLTPIVRADVNENYLENSGHITKDGNYSQAILELGKMFDIPVIDLTSLTKKLYLAKGYNEVIKYHAWTTSNRLSVDNTHLNIYGAKEVAYLIAEELLKGESSLKEYILPQIEEPTINSLIVNPSYKESIYIPFDATKYQPNYFSGFISKDWYGTAFGDCGGIPTTKETAFIAKEDKQNEFIVGQDGTEILKGKIAMSSEGIAMVFKQVSQLKNFKLVADATVESCIETKQAGFGLMLRDDIYVNAKNDDRSILSNYVCAGMYRNDEGVKIIYSRESTKLTDSNYSDSKAYQVGDKVHLEINRLGQVVDVKVFYNGKTYEYTYTDFDFAAIDKDYMYIGMYATRGTVVKFYNVDFQITGKAIKA